VSHVRFGFRRHGWFYTTSSRSEGVNDNLEVISSDPATSVLQLKSEPGKDVYLCGGARLATTLLEAGLIDEVLLKQNPVVFDTGTPLFHAAKSFEPLELLDTKVYANGVLLLRYAIHKHELTQER
jgi:dihydrofolate reductase